MRNRIESFDKRQASSGEGSEDPTENHPSDKKRADGDDSGEDVALEVS
jgi:hypothetical protein